jgi:hypothetical protein
MFCNGGLFAFLIGKREKGFLMDLLIISSTMYIYISYSGFREDD